MRIAFICGRLGPGEDGVGDYVRRLATALAARGHAVLALALRDTAAPPETGPAGERYLRYADTPATPAAARAALVAFAPDWVSLQWVSYAWHPRGLPWSTPAHLASLVPAAARRHLMAHELWVGENASAPALDRLLWHPLQRLITRRLLATWRPALVHTSNPVYAILLAELGVTASILPLPGNLPAPSADDHRAARAWLTRAGLGGESPPALAAVFGTLHPAWDASDALASWIAHQAAQNRPAALLVLGRTGPAASARLAALRSRVPDLPVVIVGEQPAPLLAGLLATCSLGLATGPWALVGKSGTAAALLEAGLPVLATDDTWQRRRGPTPPPVSHPRLHLWNSREPFNWPPFLASRADSSAESAPAALAAAFLANLAVTSS